MPLSRGPDLLTLPNRKMKAPELKVTRKSLKREDKSPDIDSSLFGDKGLLRQFCDSWRCLGGRREDPRKPWNTVKGGGACPLSQSS